MDSVRHLPDGQGNFLEISSGNSNTEVHVLYERNFLGVSENDFWDGTSQTVGACQKFCSFAPC